MQARIVAVNVYTLTHSLDMSESYTTHGGGHSVWNRIASKFIEALYVILWTVGVEGLAVLGGGYS